MLVGQVAISELQNMVISGKMCFRLQHGILKDRGPFTSKRILAFKFQPCPDPLVSWGLWWVLWFWVLFEVNSSLLCTHFGCLACIWFSCL